jgi:hypothetical protein
MATRATASASPTSRCTDYQGVLIIESRLRAAPLRQTRVRGSVALSSNSPKSCDARTHGDSRPRRSASVRCWLVLTHVVTRLVTQNGWAVRSPAGGVSAQSFRSLLKPAAGQRGGAGSAPRVDVVILQGGLELARAIG